MATEGTTPSAAVCLAVDLGWRFAELYDSKRLPGPPTSVAAELPPHLPGFGDMSDHEKACALAAHIGADLAALSKAVPVDLPDASTITTALGVPRHKRDAVRTVVRDLYVDVRDCLAGSDPAVALAFGLGRMLADTALLPTADTPDILGEEFEKWRLGNAFDWLSDLDTVLPPRAAHAVMASLRAWEEWVSKRRNDDGTIKAGKVDAVAIRALHRQANLWRRLLTGEQPAEHLLTARAYVGAAARLVGNARRLVLHYLWKWSWIIALLLAAVGAALWAAIAYAPAGSDRVAAVLVTALGSLGVSWTGVQATLGRALRQAESATWEAEVVAAIGRAATVLPKAKTDRPEPPQSTDAEDEADDPAESGTHIDHGHVA